MMTSLVELLERGYCGPHPRHGWLFLRGARDFGDSRFLVRIDFEDGSTAAGNWISLDGAFARIGMNPVEQLVKEVLYRRQINAVVLDSDAGWNSQVAWWETGDRSNSL